MARPTLDLKTCVSVSLNKCTVGSCSKYLTSGIHPCVMKLVNNCAFSINVLSGAPLYSMIMERHGERGADSILLYLHLSTSQLTGGT